MIRAVGIATLIALSYSSSALAQSSARQKFLNFFGPELLTRAEKLPIAQKQRIIATGAAMSETYSQALGYLDDQKPNEPSHTDLRTRVQMVVKTAIQFSERNNAQLFAPMLAEHFEPGLPHWGGNPKNYVTAIDLLMGADGKLTPAKSLVGMAQEMTTSLGTSCPEAVERICTLTLQHHLLGEVFLDICKSPREKSQTCSVDRAISALKSTPPAGSTPAH